MYVYIDREREMSSILFVYPHDLQVDPEVKTRRTPLNLCRNWRRNAPETEGHTNPNPKI